MRSDKVAQVMRHIRESRQLSQEEIGTALGTHQGYWSMYERGKRRPSLVLMVRMRRKIGLTDAEILDLVAAAGQDCPETTVPEADTPRVPAPASTRDLYRAYRERKRTQQRRLTPH